MARNERKRQQAIQKKAIKRKQKQQAVRQESRPRSQKSILHAAAKWPIHECLMTKDWTNPDEIVQILVARRSPDGEIVVGTFLVDLGCLGLKNVSLAHFDTGADYREKYRDVILATQKLIPTDLNLAAKVLREGIAYAASLGFPAHRDLRDGLLLLREADPDACPTLVPHGRDGKPFFFAGPYDDPTWVLAKLEKAVGPGNYDYVVPLAPSDFFDQEDDDDWEDEDEEWEDEEDGADVEGPEDPSRPAPVPSPPGSIVARLADRLKRPLE